MSEPFPGALLPKGPLPQLCPGPKGGVSVEGVLKPAFCFPKILPSQISASPWFAAAAQHDGSLPSGMSGAGRNIPVISPEFPSSWDNWLAVPPSPAAAGA